VAYPCRYARWEYLKRWEFTPQKPIRRAYEQRPEAVKQWLTEQCPEIAKRARTEGGEIHWSDETALVNTDVRGRGFARWQIIDGNFNLDRLIEFFELLIKDIREKSVLDPG